MSMERSLANAPSCEEEVLKVRVQAVGEAQRRTRAAFLVSTIISLAIIIACFNAYLSWYRGFALKNHWPQNAEVTRDAQRFAMEAWVRSTTISIPILGLNVGVGDAVVLGSLSLLITTIWLFFSVRRENHTIGLLLQETQGCTASVLHRVFHGVISYAVFTVVSEIDAPIRNLTMQPDKKESVPFTRGAFKILVYLPSIAIAFVMLMDVLSILTLPAPLREGHLPFIKVTLGTEVWIQLVLMEATGLVLLTLTTILCFRALRYNKGTEDVLKEYEALLKGNYEAARV